MKKGFKKHVITCTTDCDKPTRIKFFLSELFGPDNEFLNCQFIGFWDGQQFDSYQFYCSVEDTEYIRKNIYKYNGLTFE